MLGDICFVSRRWHISSTWPHSPFLCSYHSITDTSVASEFFSVRCSSNYNQLELAHNLKLVLYSDLIYIQLSTTHAWNSFWNFAIGIHRSRVIAWKLKCQSLAYAPTSHQPVMSFILRNKDHVVIFAPQVSFQKMLSFKGISGLKFPNEIGTKSSLKLCFSISSRLWGTFICHL